MLVIKYILVLLSFLQYIQSEVFWRGHFIWFMLWVILFHLNWFYLDHVKYKRLNNILLSILAIINILMLPTIPFMMLGLLTIELREAFTRQVSLILLGLLTLGVSIMLYLTQAALAYEYILYSIGAVIVCGYITEQNAQVNDQQKQLYAYQKQLADSNEKLISLKAQMIAMEEIHTLNERNRISRDLHDSVGHTLSTIVIQLAAIAKLTEESSPQASSMLTHLQEFAKEGLKSVRSVIHELKPSHYQKIAFIEKVHHIINDFERNSPIKVFFNNNQLLWELTPEQELLIIRGIQEFLSNSSKHSQATEVRIRCHFTDSSLILTMTDNGKGTDNIQPQMGISGMKERTKLLGGKINIKSSINQGFTIRIILPKHGGIINE